MHWVAYSLNTAAVQLCWTAGQPLVAPPQQVKSDHTRQQCVGLLGWPVYLIGSHTGASVVPCALSPTGPSYTVPFLGSIVEMVQDPHAFWERQRAYSFPGLSWNSIVTKFTVMVTDPAVIRHVFQHNR